MVKKWVIVTEAAVSAEPNAISIYCPCHLYVRNPSSEWFMIFGDSSDLETAIANTKTYNYPKFLFDTKEEAEEFIQVNNLDNGKARAAMYFIKEGD